MPGVLPSRHDFDPLDLVYRLVGTEAAAILGLNVTGKKLSERPVWRDREAILDEYRVAIEDRVPRFRRFNVFDARRGFRVSMERLHLPMATDSRTVAAALTFELVGSENMHESNPHVFVVGSGAELKIADQDSAVDECVAV